MVVRIAAHEPQGIKPFAENLDLIEKDYRTAMASEAAAEIGATVLAEPRSGAKTLQQVAAERAWGLEQPGDIKRDDAAEKKIRSHHRTQYIPDFR